MLSIAIQYLLFFAHASVVLTGSAARVGSHVITVREVNYFSVVHRLREKKWLDPFLALSNEDLRRYTKRLRLEDMCLSEIKTLEFVGPKRSDAEDLVSLQKAKTKSAWNEFLKFYGKNEGQVTETLFRSLTVDKFLEKKMETLTPLITEEEITQYLGQTRATPSAPPLEGDKETMRQSVSRLLRQERMQKGLENWLQSLQEKYTAVSLLAQ